MKVKRGLSGIYYRSKNTETGKFENVVFEDLNTEEQDKILEGASEEYLKNMIKRLSEVINDIGNQLDLFANQS